MNIIYYCPSSASRDQVVAQLMDYNLVADVRLRRARGAYSVSANQLTDDQHAQVIGHVFGITFEVTH